MVGQNPVSPALASWPQNDPNELLRRVDRNTAATFRWVKVGLVVIIVLLVVVVVGY